MYRGDQDMPDYLAWTSKDQNASALLLVLEILTWLHFPWSCTAPIAHRANQALSWDQLLSLRASSGRLVRRVQCSQRENLLNGTTKQLPIGNVLAGMVDGSHYWNLTLISSCHSFALMVVSSWCYLRHLSSLYFPLWGFQISFSASNYTTSRLLPSISKRGRRFGA